MAEQCRWCKGTRVILGFAWNTYPCECVSAPKAKALFEWQDGMLLVNGGSKAGGWQCVCKNPDIAGRFADWLEEAHPAMIPLSFDGAKDYYAALDKGKAAAFDAWCRGE